MNSVLVGMFDTEADALAARNKLMAAGFNAAALQMTGGATSAAEPVTSATTAATTSATDTGSSTTASHAEGAITRFFENLFGADDGDERRGLDSHRSTYTEAFNRGSYGLTVRTTNESEVDRAEQILNAAGAIDIDERSDEWRKDGWTGHDVADTTDSRGTRKLQEVEEALTVGKKTVDRGGVRVFTRVTETPVEESVTLREEQATIRRTVVDRVASPADLVAFKEGSVEIRETGEEAVVQKTARVVGEVEVGKTSTEREETIRDTVRQSKVEVEKIAADGTGTVERRG